MTSKHTLSLLPPPSFLLFHSFFLSFLVFATPHRKSRKSSGTWKLLLFHAALIFSLDGCCIFDVRKVFRFLFLTVRFLIIRSACFEISNEYRFRFVADIQRLRGFKVPEPTARPLSRDLTAFVPQPCFS